MKRIYDTERARTVWRGTDYLVDGQPGIVEPPLYLLDEIDAPRPDHDPETQIAERQPPAADIEALEWRAEWTVRDLTAEEIASRRDLIADLREAWAQFPDELRPQFAVHFAAVRNLVQADMIPDARAFVAAIDLPAELEEYRTEILALLD